MKKENLFISELINSFSGRNFIRKADLRDFYISQSGELSEKNFPENFVCFGEARHPPPG